MDEPVAKVAGLHPVVDRVKVAEPLHSGQVVEGGTNRFEPVAHEFGYQFVADGVLQEAESGDECVQTFG